jgi:hypothetical protein
VGKEWVLRERQGSFTLTIGEPGRLVGTVFAHRAKEHVMTIPESFPRRLPRLVSTPPVVAESVVEASTSAYDGSVESTRPHWKWRDAALFLCVGAQLATISALLGSVPVPATWASLLLAIAPIPLAVLTAYSPVRFAKVLAPLTAVVLVIGIVGSITHAGWVFVPALVVLVMTAMRLGRLHRQCRTWQHRSACFRASRQPGCKSPGP